MFQPKLKNPSMPESTDYSSEPRKLEEVPCSEIVFLRVRMDGRSSDNCPCYWVPQMTDIAQQTQSIPSFGAKQKTFGLERKKEEVTKIQFLV